jgi:hypothetical protein
VLLHEQFIVFLLLERVLVYWSLAIDKRGGHEDLCGSILINVVDTKIYVVRTVGA